MPLLYFIIKWRLKSSASASCAWWRYVWYWYLIQVLWEDDQTLQDLVTLLQSVTCRHNDPGTWLSPDALLTHDAHRRPIVQLAFLYVTPASHLCMNHSSTLDFICFPRTSLACRSMLPLAPSPTFGASTYRSSIYWTLRICSDPFADLSVVRLCDS